MSYRLVNFQKLSSKDTDIAESLYALEEEAMLNLGGQEAALGYIVDRLVVAATWVEPDGGLFTIAVLPEYQNQGLSRKLLTELISYGKKQHWEFLVCDAIHPATRHLCQDLGFTHRSSMEWYLSLEE
jgi:ribosomal protein S18 acetylase RimI-like enzyme